MPPRSVLLIPILKTAVIQIADKLCSAIGQDILDTLFAAETLGAKSNTASVRLHGQRESRQARAQRRRERARPFFFFILALAYVRESFSRQGVDRRN